jgi:hypothetical protein
MTSSKLPRPNKELRGALSPRGIGDGDPEVYTREQLKVLIRYGLQYGRGLIKGREGANYLEQAEAFRRKIEIIQIFRGLPEHLRKRPSAQHTKDEVLYGLEQIGIVSSERTLMRDYKALGGAKFLRGVKPFAPGEDKSSPLEAYRRQKPKKSRG